MSRNNKDGPRGKGMNENMSRTMRLTRNTNEEVQRAIEGLKDMPDDELHEFLDEDFMEGLNVVDAWDGEEELVDDFHHRDNRDKDNRRNSRDRNRRDYRDSGRNIRDNRDRDRDRDRDRGRRDDRRREDRRDPSKSSQDIERDKIRAKRVNESKILAEKEKAIKHLLDSGTIVPPGTEVETIENEKQMDRERDREHDREQRSHRSRDRRRSLDRHRLSPTRRRSHDRNKLSPPRRSRSPLGGNSRRSIDRHRRPSWEHHGSLERRDRRSSVDRGRRRLDERDVRIVGRRSRSRDRQRSRSQDRFRRRWSRSPGGRRNSPKRRSMSKSPEHRRKRTPFIESLARQLRDTPIVAPDSINQGYMNPPLRGIQSQQQQPLLGPGSGPGPGPGNPQISGPPQHYMPLQESLPPINPSYIPYDNMAPAGSSMNFEQLPMHSISQPDYTAPAVMYNQSNPVPIHNTPSRSAFAPVMSRSPQPVPAPPMDQPMLFHQQVSTSMQASPSPQPERIDSGHHVYSEHSSVYTGKHSSSRRDRLKTPEPPVISKSKQFEKTSLSSLLEASVSAKDTGHPVLYPGFKPEILRHCELALRDLPDEDPRLKIKGRFFYDSSKDEPLTESSELESNSVLLQKHSTKKLWYDVKEKVMEEIKPSIEAHQKYCQTDIKEFNDQFAQTEIETVDIGVQVHISEPPPPPAPPREEKIPIMDRLDWNVRESYDYNSKPREVTDLRWSLSNSSQKRWNRGVSPSSQDQDDRIMMSSPGRLSHQDHDSREYIHRIQSPIRHSDNYSSNRGPNHRSFSPRERHFSPDFRQDSYHENRNERSREPSPIMLDEHDDVEILEQEPFLHDPNWRGRNNKSFGQNPPVHKSRSARGKHSSGRSFRGRGGGGSSSYRGKY